MASDFHFVDWTQISGPSKDPATRRLIRKQAMSKVAADRRQKGVWRHKSVTASSNTQTPPIPEPQPFEGTHDDPRSHPKNRPNSPSQQTNLIEDSLPHDDIDEYDIDASPTIATETSIFTPFIPPSMPSKDYEMMRIESDFDLLDLSAMTTFHVGRITTMSLFNNPAQLAGVIQCRQWSYFSFLPPRWGYCACLDDAARCVASRVRNWIRGIVDPVRETLMLYSKALVSLQAALNNPKTYMQPEVLCATEILSIYEVSKLPTSR